MSEVTPYLPCGTWSSTHFLRAGFIVAVSGVSIQPGAIALDRIPKDAHSTACISATFRIALLVAPYTERS